MTSLRVRLEFPDGEKYWLFINLAKIKMIQDVIDDINCKYSVTCEKLLLDDAQLYCKETVDILQDKDLIRVNLKPSKKRKKVTEDNQISNSPEPVEEVEKFSLSKPKKKKKSKGNEVLEHEDLNRQLTKRWEKVKNHLVVEKETTVVEGQRRVKECRAEPEIEVKLTENATNLYITDSNATKKDATQFDATELNTTDNKELSVEGGAKRRRRRKRKSHNKSEAVDSGFVQTFEAQQEYLPPVPKERQHLRFNGDSGEDTEPETCLADTGTTGFGNHIKNESVGSNKANHSCSNGEKMVEPKKFAKAFVHSPSAIGSPVVPQLGTLLSLRSAVFTRNSNEKSTPPSYNSVPPPQSSASSEVVPSSPRASDSLPVKAPLKLDPTTFPIIKGLPRVNDLIAFKVLELTENYNPELSDYMQGRITHMSPNSDITVQLLDPKPKRHSRGKFELIERDEEEYEEEAEIEYESTVTYQWNEMIEPRLIFP